MSDESFVYLSLTPSGHVTHHLSEYTALVCSGEGRAFELYRVKHGVFDRYWPAEGDLGAGWELISPVDVPPAVQLAVSPEAEPIEEPDPPQGPWCLECGPQWQALLGSQVELCQTSAEGRRVPCEECGQLLGERCYLTEDEPE